MVEAPIFHVNGDDPEAVLYVTQLALDYRQTFHKDVVIDIVCFRKLGHNEQDEPFVTQPLMYKKIGQHQGTRRLYAEKLVSQGVIGADAPDAMIKQFRAALDAGQHLLHLRARRSVGQADDGAQPEAVARAVGLGSRIGQLAVGNADQRAVERAQPCRAQSDVLDHADHAVDAG